MHPDGLFAIFRYMDTCGIVLLLIFSALLAYIFMYTIRRDSRTDKLYDRWLSLFRLVKGWDGYDAEPIDPKTLENARQIIHDLEWQTCQTGDWELFPTSRGTIQFERTGLFGNNYYEVEVYSDHFVHYSHVSGEDVEIMLTGAKSVVDLMRADMKWHWLKWRYWFPKKVRNRK